MNCLRPKDAAKKLGISRMQLHRWSSNPEYSHLQFPKPLTLGANSVGFVEAELDAWLESRAAGRDGEAA